MKPLLLLPLAGSQSESSEPLLSTFLAAYYHIIERADDLTCPEDPNFSTDNAEIIPCPWTNSTKKDRSVAFYLITEKLPNSCYYTTEEAIRSQIELAIRTVKEKFGLTINPLYLNDGCSPSESLNTAIQRYLTLTR